jgi:adenylate cyclase
MVENTKNAVRIDLNEFKLHIHLKNRIQLTLHFNSPSRRFYLSVIALVVNEMKRLGKITSIPMEAHLGLLALLNETIGGSAGSSDRGNLLPRIYRKWKDVLPDLEDAPLFKVLGRRKEHDEGIGRAYPFTEDEKDSWANLFEYMGSEENVRLKFAIDKIGVSLNETSIIFRDSLNGDAWDQFISSLKNGGKEEPKPVEETAVREPPTAAYSSAKERKISRPSRYRWVMLVVAIGIVIGAIWKLHLSPAPIQVATVDRRNCPLPDVPSIAVLPFVNMSNEPKQDYLTDCLAEEIINGLSKCPHIVVIARNLSFTYKGKHVKVQQIAEELGVRNVLEGSLRKTGDTVRIAVQLIDALTGQHLFSERYDRELKDILIMQDEITMKILDAVQVKLTAGEDARLRSKGTKNLEAYLKLMQARQYIRIYNKGNYALARELTEQAIALDPQYAVAYATLCRIQLMEVLFGVYKNHREALEQAAKIGEKAITLDDSNALTHARLGPIYLYLKEYDKAISEAEKAVSLDPNSADAYLALGSALQYAGRPQEGIPFLKKSLCLSPIPIDTTALIILGVAYRQLGQYEEAAANLKRAVQLYGADDLIGHLNLAATYALIGHEKEARAEAREVLRIDPTFSVEPYSRRLPYKHQKAIDDLVSGLRKAGLK